jgi:ribosome modulation factor
VRAADRGTCEVNQTAGSSKKKMGPKTSLELRESGANGWRETLSRLPEK